MRNNAFTLVELLVVIAIIFLLVAMVLPVIRSVRAQARRVVCSSNMQQLFLGFSSYATDNRGTVPYTGNYEPSIPSGSVDWVGYKIKKLPDGGSLWQYIQEKKVYICPADSKMRNKGGNVCWVPAYATHSYSVPRTRECDPISELAQNKALLVDEAERTINDGEFNNHWDALASRHVLSGFAKVERANAGCNILYAGGTVEFFKTGQIIYADHQMFK